MLKRCALYPSRIRPCRIAEFVSLTATAPDNTKLVRRRAKQRERKINLVTGPTLCKPYTSIHQNPPGLPTNLDYTACQCEREKKCGGEMLFRFLRVSEFDRIQTYPCVFCSKERSTKYQKQKKKQTNKIAYRTHLSLFSIKHQFMRSSVHGWHWQSCEKLITFAIGGFRKEERKKEKASTKATNSCTSVLNAGYTHITCCFSRSKVILSYFGAEASECKSAFSERAVFICVTIKQIFHLYTLTVCVAPSFFIFGSALLYRLDGRSSCRKAAVTHAVSITEITKRERGRADSAGVSEEIEFGQRQICFVRNRKPSTKATNGEISR